jgi:formylglycine-generating enzyme required for sulfatase activity
LPTEAEWEYACRAGTTTSRPYGDDDAMLPRYDLCRQTVDEGIVQPVGILKPNDFGLFDMLGNVTELCQGEFGDYKAGPGGPGWASPDVEALREVNDLLELAARGGDYHRTISWARSAARTGYQANSRAYHVGFRVARTIR